MPERGPHTHARLLKGGMVAAVVAVFALLLVVAGCAQKPQAVAPSVQHPAVAQGQPCSACKVTGHALVHRAPYTGPCMPCHNLRSWTQISFKHRDRAFDVGFHEVIGCDFCHTPKRPLPSADCGGCHKPTTHPVLANCERCHTALSWRTPEPVPAGHVSLAGGHATLQCFACHKGSKPFALRRACVSCHGVKHGGLRNCTACHDPRYGWKAKPGFRHSRYFRLTGVHTRIRCTKCHPRFNFVATRPQCVSCHRVRHGGLTDCARCHTTSAFRPATFHHGQFFRLVGAHRRLGCSACHPGGAFARLIGSGGTACVSCHGARHGGLTRCASCHTTTTFDPSTFRHASVWRLTGAHARVRCTKCHPKGRFAKAIGSPARCRNCHGNRHHVSIDCSRCHTTKTFSRAKPMNHPGPPTLGDAHASRPCSLCHSGLIFNATRPCADCHTAPHITLGQGCLDCHRPTVWISTTFAHPEIGYHTNLPITQACPYCHTGSTFATYVCDQCHTPF